MRHGNNHVHNWDKFGDRKLEHHCDTHHSDYKWPLSGDPNTKRTEMAIVDTKPKPYKGWGLEEAVCMSFSWMIGELLGKKEE